MSHLVSQLNSELVSSEGKLIIRTWRYRLSETWTAGQHGQTTAHGQKSRLLPRCIGANCSGRAPGSDLVAALLRVVIKRSEITTFARAFSGGCVSPVPPALVCLPCLSGTTIRDSKAPGIYWHLSRSLTLSTSGNKGAARQADVSITLRLWTARRLCKTQCSRHDWLWPLIPSSGGMECEVWPEQIWEGRLVQVWVSFQCPSRCFPPLGQSLLLLLLLAFLIAQLTPLFFAREWVPPSGFGTFIGSPCHPPCWLAQACHSLPSSQWFFWTWMHFFFNPNRIIKCEGTFLCYDVQHKFQLDARTRGFTGIGGQGSDGGRLWLRSVILDRTATVVSGLCCWRKQSIPKIEFRKLLCTSNPPKKLK